MNIRTLFGIILLLAGCSLFLIQGNSIDAGKIFAYFWPSIFIIPLGLFFHWLYFSMIGRGVGLLVPGGVLITVGVVCQISMLFNTWHYMWPGFILAPAVGLFELYWYGGRNKWLFIPINILTVLSVLFFIIFSLSSLLNQLSIGKPIIAITFILIGSAILLIKKKEF